MGGERAAAMHDTAISRADAAVRPVLAVLSAAVVRRRCVVAIVLGIARAADHVAAAARRMPDRLHLARQQLRAAGLAR